MGKQAFIKPDGSIVTLEQPDFQAAQDRGYKLYDPATPKSDYASDHPEEAARRGFLSTVTLGGSDAFLSGYEGGADASKQLKAENPAADVVGQGAGFLLPSSPAEAIAGKAGQLGVDIAKGAGAGKVLQRVAGGVGNGGIWGLGSAISEDTMGDPKQAGEHYAAGVLGGALAGAGTNVVLGKMGDIGKSVLMKAFGGKALQDSLSEMAENQVMKTIATPSDMGKRNLAKRSSEVARQALDEGLVGGGKSVARGAQDARAAADQAYSDVELGLQAADMAGKFDPERVALRMQPLINELERNPSMSEIRNHLQTFADKFAPVTQHGTPGHQPPGTLFDAQGNMIMPPYVPGTPATKVVNPEAPLTFQKAWETVEDTLEQVGQAAPKGFKRELFKLRGELQDEVFQQANRLNPGLGDQIQSANRLYANFASFRDLATKTATRQELAKGGDLYAAGGLLFGGPVGFVKGAGISAAKNALKERGGFALASAMDAIAQNKTFGRIASALQKSIQNGLESSPAFGGPFRAMLETAAAEGAIKLMETHLRLANTEPEYLASVGMPPEEPDVVPEYADKAHRLAQIYGTVDSSEDSVSSSIRRFLGTQPGRAPEVTNRTIDPSEFAELKQQLKAMRDGHEPDARLSEIAPNIALAGAMTVQNAANYLLERAPQDPNEDKPKAMQRPWEPGTDELRRWARCVSAVANPLLVVDQMRAGRVTPEALDAVKEVYPTIFAQLQAQLQSHLAEMTSPLDRKRLDAANVLLGDLGDRDVDALIQEVHAASIPQQGPKKPDGREKIDASKNQLTQAQRLEGKSDEAVS